jgi:hypothetical protein
MRVDHTIQLLKSETLAKLKFTLKFALNAQRYKSAISLTSMLKVVDN